MAKIITLQQSLLQEIIAKNATWSWTKEDWDSEWEIWYNSSKVDLRELEKRRIDCWEVAIWLKEQIALEGGIPTWKRRGCSVASLRSANHRLWSHLGCSRVEHYLKSWWPLLICCFKVLFLGIKYSSRHALIGSLIQNFGRVFQSGPICKGFFVYGNLP